MLKSFREKKPRIDASAFIAETSSIVGDVEIGPRVSVWYGVTLRGDINSIVIGEETNIQEGSVVHVDSPETRGTGGRTVLGKRVTVGHGAIIHACEIGDECLIGMGAIIRSAAIRKKSFALPPAIMSIWPKSTAGIPRFDFIRTGCYASLDPMNLRRWRFSACFYGCKE